MQVCSSGSFAGIPRSAQPPLTSSQRRILESTYHLAEAKADMPYALFVPSTYDRRRPVPLIVTLHGLNITPLQQILFDAGAAWRAATTEPLSATPPSDQEISTCGTP